jgi:uncharacterized protein YjbJ (UPF0337 family)
MGGKADIVKGRIEEAAGALTGSEKLRQEGQTDQAVGHAKQAAEKVVDDAKAACCKAADKAKEVAEKAKRAM